MEEIKQKDDGGYFVVRNGAEIILTPAEVRNTVNRQRLDNTRMANKHYIPPKDYADKSDLLATVDKRYPLAGDDWEYHNKESFSDLARYFLFIFVGAMCGVLFCLGVLS